MSDKTKGAMAMVIEDMGRAARERRARRFNRKRGAKASPGSDVEVDPVKEAGMSAEEMEELSSSLDVQR